MLIRLFGIITSITRKAISNNDNEKKIINMTEN